MNQVTARGPWQLGASLVAVLALGLAGGCTSTGQKDTATELQLSRSDAAHADKILVKKSEHKLYLLKDGQPIRMYRVSLGISKGPKLYQGDNRTPEGVYYVDGRNAGSKFYKALHISYPNAKDRLEAARRGRSPGGQIMIHGQPGGSRDQELRDIIQSADWTAGCIAVSNAEIDEIWRYTLNGTPIEIQP